MPWELVPPSQILIINVVKNMGSTYEWGDHIDNYTRAGWVWKITGSSSRLQVEVDQCRFLQEWPTIKGTLYPHQSKPRSAMQHPIAKWSYETCSFTLILNLRQYYFATFSKFQEKIIEKTLTTKGVTMPRPKGPT